MDTILKILIFTVVFAAGFTVGQNHYPLDFNGDGKLTGNDLKTAMQHLTEKH